MKHLTKRWNIQVGFHGHGRPCPRAAAPTEAGTRKGRSTQKHRGPLLGPATPEQKLSVLVQAGLEGGGRGADRQVRDRTSRPAGRRTLASRERPETPPGPQPAPARGTPAPPATCAHTCRPGRGHASGGAGVRHPGPGSARDGEGAGGTAALPAGRQVTPPSGAPSPRRGAGPGRAARWRQRAGRRGDRGRGAQGRRARGGGRGPPAAGPLTVDSRTWLWKCCSRADTSSCPSILLHARRRAIARRPQRGAGRRSASPGRGPAHRQPEQGPRPRPRPLPRSRPPPQAKTLGMRRARAARAGAGLGAGPDVTDGAARQRSAPRRQPGLTGRSLRPRGGARARPQGGEENGRRRGPVPELSEDTAGVARGAAVPLVRAKQWKWAGQRRLGALVPHRSH